MNGTTSVDQGYEFRFMQFLENEKEMEKEETDDLEKGLNVKNIRGYLNENGSIEIPVVEENELDR